jgi:hypothetical protein
MALSLWKIEPIARAEDPRWLDHPRFERLVVRAETAAEARQIAAAEEIGEDTDAVGNESLGDAAGFKDEKLYRVMPLADEERGTLSPEGRPAVLSRLAG